MAWLRRLLMSAASRSSRACAAPVGGRVAATTAQMSRRSGGVMRMVGDLRGDRAHAHRGQHRDAEPVLDEFGEVLHVLRFADGTPGESGGGTGDVDLGA